MRFFSIALLIGRYDLGRCPIPVAADGRAGAPARGCAAQAAETLLGWRRNALSSARSAAGRSGLWSKG